MSILKRFFEELHREELANGSHWLAQRIQKLEVSDSDPEAAAQELSELWDEYVAEKMLGGE